MPSYVGPARLVVDGTVHQVAVNLQPFVDLSAAPHSSGAGWRGVVVDAGFVPAGIDGRVAEVQLPDGRGATGVLTERRLEGTGFGTHGDGAGWGMDSETPQTLVGIAFPDVFRAQEFLTATTRLSVNGQLKLKDAVFVTKDDQGHTMVKETADLQTGQAAVSGAIWAGIFGLIVGGPVGWLAGAAIGAGAGAITAKAIDLGITDEWVQWFREAVEPGNTILALLCENLDREALTEELSRFPNAQLVYANVDDAWLERMHEALGESIVTEPAVDTTEPPVE